MCSQGSPPVFVGPSTKPTNAHDLDGREAPDPQLQSLLGELWHRGAILSDMHELYLSGQADKQNQEDHGTLELLLIILRSI